MDFNGDFFAKFTGRIEEIPLYPTYYCHYFMMTFLLDIMTTAGIILPQYNNDEPFYGNFFAILFENLNSSVLTGLEAFAEFQLDYPYICLYDELRKLTSFHQDKLVFYATPHNKSLEIAIKEYSLITKMYAKYAGARTDKDIGKIIFNPAAINGKTKITKNDVLFVSSDVQLDKVSGVFSKIRITEGSSAMKMRVDITLSGQRIINRIFDSKSNVHDNVKIYYLPNYISFLTQYMISFLLWMVLKSTKQANNNFQDSNMSNIAVYRKYVRRYLKTKSRNVALNTAIAIMLSEKTPEEQEMLINRYFSQTDTKQKASLRDGIKRITQIRKNMKIKKPFVSRLLRELWYERCW